MDPFSLTFFGILVPAALVFIGFLVWRFRKNHVHMMNGYKSVESVVSKSSQPSEKSTADNVVEDDGGFADPFGTDVSGDSESTPPSYVKPSDNPDSSDSR